MKGVVKSISVSRQHPLAEKMERVATDVLQGLDAQAKALEEASDRRAEIAINRTEQMFVEMRSLISHAHQILREVIQREERIANLVEDLKIKRHSDPPGWWKAEWTKRKEAMKT